jgi:hypothetical protein
MIRLFDYAQSRLPRLRLESRACRGLTTNGCGPKKTGVYPSILSIVEGEEALFTRSVDRHEPQPKMVAAIHSAVKPHFQAALEQTLTRV